MFNIMMQIAETPIVTEKYRKHMDELEIDNYFLFPAESRQTVSQIMSVNFHMKPSHITTKRFEVSKIDEDDRYLKLTRVKDFE